MELAIGIILACCARIHGNIYSFDLVNFLSYIITSLLIPVSYNNCTYAEFTSLSDQ